jgi:hypothetical protein
MLTLWKSSFGMPLGRLLVVPGPPAAGGPPLPADTPLMGQLRGFLARNGTAELRDNVLHADSNVRAWFALKDAAIRKSFAQRAQLARELSNLVKDSAESIDENIAAMYS